MAGLLEKSILTFGLVLGLAGASVAQPPTLAGFPFHGTGAPGRNDQSGQLGDGAGAVNVTYHTRGSTVTDAFLTSPLNVTCNGYTFGIERARYLATDDAFLGDARLSGPGLPSRLQAQGVRFNSKGILGVAGLGSRGWGTLHTPWSVGRGKLTPKGLAWNEKLREVEVTGLYLQGKFHPELEAQVKNGRVVAVKLAKPSTVLHQRRVAFIKEVVMRNDEMYVTGYTGAPNGKKWFFKNILVEPDGTLHIDFPLSWAPPVEPVQLRPAARRSPLAPSGPGLSTPTIGAGQSLSLPLLASASGLPPTLPATLQKAVQGAPPMPDALFAPSKALEKAIAAGLQVVPVAGSSTLQMVVTQTSQDGKTVDGFIPLMDWVGQAQVYGATLNSNNTVSVQSATMNWLKKEVRPPASGFGLVQLSDPVTLNTATGRLTSNIGGTAAFRGMTAGLMSWEVDTKEFRLECGNFAAIGAKLNPLGGGAPWSFQMSTTGQGINVAGAPSTPANMPMANPNDPINVGYQGGTEFDIVFLEGGDWGFEFRTAIPQLDMGGPEWLRTGTAIAPKGVAWPTIVAKIYNRGFVYFNFVGQGISIPFDDGLAFSNPGLLFSYTPDQALFFLVAQTQITIEDVNANIFAVKGKLFIDGSGMGKSGGGEAELSGYILNVLVSEFDVGFAAVNKGDGTYEEQFAITVPVCDILGFLKVEVSGEVNVNAPADEFTVGVSGWVHIIFFDIGVTFYGYADGHVTFAFGGHEFHPASDGSGNSQYTGPFSLLGINWFGTEIVDSTKGGVTAAGNSTWTGSNNADGATIARGKLASAANKLSAAASITQASISEESVTSANLKLTNVTVNADYNGQTLTANVTTLPLSLDSTNGRFTGTISDVNVVAGKYKGPITVDLDVSFTGTVKAVFNLPESEGGPLTEELTLTSTGQSK